MNVHLEIETGMNRTGININNLENIINKIKNSNITIDGVYSHLSSADYDKEFTERQLSLFKNALSIVKNNGITPKYIHISASNGILNYEPLEYTNMIRPGIIIYGYEPFKGSKKIIDTEPICKFKSIISFIKEVEKGEAISYSQKYKCSEKRTIATIPIGYGDGFRRELTNKGYILVNKIKCPIVGNVCMDNCMIDITDVDNIKVGDEVVIFDNENIKVEDIANICNTINYEILCNISPRVPRLFINDK